MVILNMLTVVVLVAALAYGEGSRPNVDIFPSNPSRNDLSKWTYLSPFIRYEPCREPFIWSTLVNDCVLIKHQCVKKKSIFGGFKNSPSAVRKQKIIEMSCRKSECEAKPTIKDICSSSQHLIITRTQIETSSAFGNLILLNGIKKYVITPEDLNSTTNLVLPAFIADPNITFIYQSTDEDINTLKIELEVCCQAKKLEKKTKPSSCADAHEQGHGIRELEVNGQSVFSYCEGTWTVIQRRVDDSVDFNRNWTDYAAGFGDLTGNFWWGNDKLYGLISSQPQWLLRIDLEGFEGQRKQAEYNNFTIMGPKDDYKLQSLGTYSGTAGNSLASSVGNKFSTKDRDNDVVSGQCAVAYKSGWWFNKCYHANLNGRWKSPSEIEWYHFYNTFDKGLSFSTMKIKPAQ